jgi:hypothetical protein
VTYFQLCGHTVIPTLESPEGKLRRAETHLEVFDSQLTLFYGLHKHTITVEDDPRTSEYVFKVYDIQQTDPDWSYLVGDCIHNLRSALDHLVYQLAILALGRDLTEDEARSCMFPIHIKREQWNRGRIKLLRPGEQTRIEELQPFNAADSSLWLPTPGYLQGVPALVPSLLGRLETLEVVDKHRLVHATWRAAEWFNAAQPPIPLIGYETIGDALENGAEVGRWHYDLPRPDLPANMDMHRYFPIGVALGDPPFMNGAVELLSSCRDAVAAVIDIFRPCITEGLPALPLSAIV